MLMYVPIVYGFLPEINVFVFVLCNQVVIELVCMCVCACLCTCMYVCISSYSS